MTNKKLDFSVERFDLVDENPNSQFATAKIQAFSSSINKHDMNCSEEVLQKTAPSIFFKPILYNINKIFDSFNSHADPEHTLIGGFCVPNSEEFVRLPDGRLAFNIIARLFKRYVPKVMEILKRDNGAKVSVEMDLLDSEERPDGIIEMKNFEYSGICLLGEFVQPASEGAHLEMLSFAEEQNLYNGAVEKEFGFRYDDIDMSIPASVKKNVELGLSLYKQHNKGGNSVSLANARFISKSQKANHEKIRHISKSLKAKKFNNMVKDPPSEEYISFLLYGGLEGKDWSEKIEQQLDQRDNQHLSYFGEKVTFPYTSINDINSALKGIKPEISLEQANEISRQADGIGADKNGWPIAISAFRKSHKVVDGKWVKKSDKEEINMEDEVKEEMAAEKPKEEKTEKPVDEKKEEDKEQKENPSEEKTEDKKTEDEEEKKEQEKMSLSANLDVAATLAMLEDETEAYAKVKEEFEKEPEQMNYAVVANALYCKMAKMCTGMAHMAELEEKNKAYMAENEELKKFKADVESKRFSYEVDSCLSEIKNSTEMPQEEFDNLLEESKKFSLETIDAWKNLAKAKAFSFAVKSKKSKDDPIRYGFPWGNGAKQEKKSIWS